MARMIPKLDPDSISNHGEKLVYPLLRDQLPDDWTVIYDYKFCVMVDFQLCDGQVDFIVIAPKKGMLFVEVKASHGLRLDSKNQDVGYRISKDGSEERLDKTPFTQVDQHKHNVIGKIVCEKLGISKFPGIYGHIVFYPQGKLVDTPPSQATQVFWGYADKENLHRKSVAAFKNIRSLDKGEAFTDGVAKRVIEIFEDHDFVPIAGAAEADEFSQRIEGLTLNQFNTIKGLLVADLKRALVKGQAGSGKTMLALWTAMHFASAGLKTLFLCKNKSLSKWISLKHPSRIFDSYTFQGLCPKLDRNWGKRNTKEVGFWDERLPEILCDAIDQRQESERYDAIIVDEGQDFLPQWWIPIELLLKSEEEGKLYIFCDPDQKVQYDGPLRFPDVSLTYTLVANCRNPEKINNYCGNVIGKELKSMAGMPSGEPPQVITAISGMEDRAKKCLNLIKDWRSEGFEPSRIAVLSPYNSENKNSTLKLLKEKSLFNLGFNDDPRQIESWFENQCFWTSTIIAFKGLEADCIIVVDVPSSDTYFSENDFYVAVSRAKHQAVVIPADTQATVRAKNYLESS